jgi:multidrug efflux pump subunit AcrA (membrane-fusion protein)
VFDPATRTAEMEIEVPNPGYRLKPGMYARVQLTVSVRPDAVTVPNNAVVNVGGKPGVFVAVAAERAGSASQEPQPQGTGGEQNRAGGGQAGGANRAADRAMTATFTPVEVGIHDGDNVEIVSGLKDGARVITVGAGALKDGDRVVAANEGGAGGERRRGGNADSGSERGQR